MCMLMNNYQQLVHSRTGLESLHADHIHGYSYEGHSIPKCFATVSSDGEPVMLRTLSLKCLRANASLTDLTGLLLRSAV